MPQKSKVKAIVKFLDTDGNGFMEPSEVKVFISHLSGTPIESIPDDHPEVRALANIDAAALVERLCDLCDDEIIDEYFLKLGLEKSEEKVAPPLAAEESAQVQKVFESIDVDHSSTLEQNELYHICRVDSAIMFMMMDTNADNAISASEFEYFFAKLKHSYGIDTMQLVLQYLRRNVIAAQLGVQVEIFPIADLLLSNTTQEPSERKAMEAEVKKFLDGLPAVPEVELAPRKPEAPPAKPSQPSPIKTEECSYPPLDSGESSEVSQIFSSIDEDANMSLESMELQSVLESATDSKLLFVLMDEDCDGHITYKEFENFFAKVKHTHGPTTMKLLLQYLGQNIKAVQAGNAVVIIPIRELLLCNEDQGPDKKKQVESDVAAFLANNA